MFNRTSGRGGLITAIAAVMLALVSASCTTINSGVAGMFDLDTDFILEFQVASDINPDDNKKPSPLHIRMYELKADGMFEKASFIDLYERDEEVLAGDMVAVQELKRLKPGEGFKEQFVLNENTQYIGLYAEFSQYKDAVYKLVIPVVQDNIIGTHALITVSGNSLVVSKKKLRHESGGKSGYWAEQ